MPAAARPKPLGELVWVRISGTSSVSPSQPYTTEGMPTIRSIAGLRTWLIRCGAISARKMPTAIPNGPPTSDREHGHGQRADHEHRRARLAGVHREGRREQERAERDVVDEERLRALDAQVEQQRGHREDDEARGEAQGQDGDPLDAPRAAGLQRDHACAQRSVSRDLHVGDRDELVLLHEVGRVRDEVDELGRLAPRRAQRVHVLVRPDRVAAALDRRGRGRDPVHRDHLHHPAGADSAQRDVGDRTRGLPAPRRPRCRSRPRSGRSRRSARRP